MSKKTLTKAKAEKNDEFYTRMVDIASECAHYKEQFKGKVILCGCDDYKKSNFYKFFKQNFNVLGIKLLVCSGVENANTMNGSYVEFDGIAEHTTNNCDGTFQTNIPNVIAKYGANNVVFVSNVPFSLFREIISMFMSNEMKFLVIGNGNAFTYKEVFSLVKSDKIRLGYKSLTSRAWYSVPVGNKYEKMIDGEPCCHIDNSCWFTNMSVNVASKSALAKLSYDFSKPETLESYYDLSVDERNAKYPKYDNYDAINIDKCKDVPGDYFDAIGVPISFMYYLDPAVWEVVKFRKGNDDKDLCVNGKCPYFRVIIKRKK